MNFKKQMISLLALLVLLSGCATTGSGPDWKTCALIGAGGGAAIGAVVQDAHNDDEDILETAGYAAAGGAVLGGIVCALMSDSDSDGDGIPNDRDQCPNTPEGAKIDDNGCALDTDGDGVADYQDDCPKTPAGAKVDAKGCAIDSDKDGVPDGIDRCPGTPAGTPTDATGCALGIDSDNDGVVDAQDQCPNTPAGTKVNAFGCPDAQPVVLNGVNFEFDSARLLPESKTILNGVVEALKANPGLQVKVVGHCDSRGSDAYNMKLSDARAWSVRNYLVSKGITSSDVDAEGRGERDPVATNKTDAGRAENRRVEIHTPNVK